MKIKLLKPSEFRKKANRIGYVLAHKDSWHIYPQWVLILSILSIFFTIWFVKELVDIGPISHE